MDIVSRENIRINYNTTHKQEDGIVSSYIPGFDIYYSSPDIETAKKRSAPLIHNFLKFWGSR